MVYSSYLLFSTLSSNPNESCNPYVNYETVWNYIIGIVITVLSIGYSCFAMYSSIGTLCSLLLTIITCGKCRGFNNSESSKESILDNNNNNNTDDDKSKYDTRRNLGSFYIILLFATCYMAMTLTDWVSDSGYI